MENQTKNTPAVLAVKNDSNNLAQEAASLAQSLNKRLQSLSGPDAEVFMANFEKNVLLLPKNTKKVTSNHLTESPKQVADTHDFVTLDSNDTSTNNEMSNGITLFGTSKPPPPSMTKHFSPPKPWAFLKEDDKTGDQKMSEKPISNINHQRQRLESGYKQENLTQSNLLATRNHMFGNNDAVKNSISPNKDAKMGYGSASTEAKTTLHSKNVTENFETSAKNEKPNYYPKALHKYESNKENTLKTNEFVQTNSKSTSNLVIPQNNSPPNIPSHISRPLSLNAVQTQVANVTQQMNDWLQQEKLNQMQKLGNRKSINILVLGQTGVGKSTWINAFANYLTYSTLENAIAAKAPVCVIPTKFSLFDDNYQRHEILLGQHDNEIFSDKGQSATQNAKTYLFEKDGYDIYIIDTPGMDDTRGSKQDDENVKKILRAVAPFKELHAICFLFKANEARLTQSFKYCISKLLGNLSKSALNNTCFVFTNARGTFYKPGDTMGPLKAYFKELYDREGLSVTINDSNTFCLDNEAFRFICAYFSKIKFGDHELKTYVDSWRHSSNEIIRLLNHAARLRPHATSETLSINETRTWILQLVKPIIDVSSIIQTNLQQLNQDIKELETTRNNIIDLQKRTAIPITALETRKMDNPQTVCTNSKCIEYKNIDGKMQLIYKTICHKPCYLTFSDSSQVHDPNLVNCVAFLSDHCRKCGCSINDHERQIYEQKIVTKHLETKLLKDTLASEIDATKLKRKFIRQYQAMIDGYTKELEYVLFAMAKFSTFLTQNGISQTSDIFEKHLEHLIKSEEKMLRSISNSDNKQHVQSVNLLLSYQDIRHKLIKDSTSISLIEIQDIRQKLFAMPLTGSKIAEIFDIHVTVDAKEHADNVTRCDNKSMIRQCFDWTTNKFSSLFGRK